MVFLKYVNKPLPASVPIENDLNLRVVIGDQFSDLLPSPRYTGRRVCIKGKYIYYLEELFSRVLTLCDGPFGQHELRGIFSSPFILLPSSALEQFKDEPVDYYSTDPATYLGQGSAYYAPILLCDDTSSLNDFGVSPSGASASEAPLYCSQRPILCRFGSYKANISSYLDTGNVTTKVSSYPIYRVTCRYSTSWKRFFGALDHEFNSGINHSHSWWTPSILSIKYDKIQLKPGWTPLTGLRLKLEYRTPLAKIDPDNPDEIVEGTAGCLYPFPDVYAFKSPVTETSPEISSGTSPEAPKLYVGPIGPIPTIYDSLPIDSLTRPYMSLIEELLKGSGVIDHGRYNSFLEELNTGKYYTHVDGTISLEEQSSELDEFWPDDALTSLANCISYHHLLAVHRDLKAATEFMIVSPYVGILCNKPIKNSAGGVGDYPFGGDYDYLVPFSGAYAYSSGTFYAKKREYDGTESSELKDDYRYGVHKTIERPSGQLIASTRVPITYTRKRFKANYYGSPPTPYEKWERIYELDELISCTRELESFHSNWWGSSRYYVINTLPDYLVRISDHYDDDSRPDSALFEKSQTYNYGLLTSTVPPNQGMLQYDITYNYCSTEYELQKKTQGDTETPGAGSSDDDSKPAHVIEYYDEKFKATETIIEVKSSDSSSSPLNISLELCPYKVSNLGHIPSKDGKHDTAEIHNTQFPISEYIDRVEVKALLVGLGRSLDCFTQRDARGCAGQTIYNSEGDPVSTPVDATLAPCGYGRYIANCCLSYSIIPLRFNVDNMTLTPQSSPSPPPDNSPNNVDIQLTSHRASGQTDDREYLIERTTQSLKFKDSYIIGMPFLFCKVHFKDFNIDLSE